MGKVKKAFGYRIVGLPNDKNVMNFSSDFLYQDPLFNYLLKIGKTTVNLYTGINCKIGTANRDWFRISETEKIYKLYYHWKTYTFAAYKVNTVLDEIDREPCFRIRNKSTSVIAVEFDKYLETFNGRENIWLSASKMYLKPQGFEVKRANSFVYDYIGSNSEIITFSVEEGYSDICYKDCYYKVDLKMHPISSLKCRIIKKAEEIIRQGI